MHLLSGQRRETFVQIEAHLVTEDGHGARAGAVIFTYAFVADPLQQIEICTHGSHRRRVPRLRWRV